MKSPKPSISTLPTEHRLPSILLQRVINVHLAGCGGTGSQILSGLAPLHIALLALGHPGGLHVTTFDPDQVTISNVGRQLFSPSDIGAYKADVLTTRINMYYGLAWDAVALRYDSPAGAMHQAAYGNAPDILISCVDSAATRRDIAEVVEVIPPLYWLDCGNAQHTGQVFLTEPLCRNFGTRMMCSCSRCDVHRQSLPLPQLHELLPEVFDPSIPEENRPSCSLAEALRDQGLYINRAIALSALILLEKLLREGKLTQHGAWVNLESGVTLPVPVRAPAPLTAFADAFLVCEAGAGTNA